MGGGQAGAKPRPAVLLTLYMTIILVNARGKFTLGSKRNARGSIWPSVLCNIAYDPNRGAREVMPVTMNLTTF
jgi:hypothetical protein